MKSAEELTREFEERRSRDSGRIAEYDRMTGPYFGDDNLATRKIIANYADGRAALRPTAEPGSSSNQRDVLNLIPQIVDSIVAVRGVNPTMTVKPEDNEEHGREMQTKRTRALREQYTHSGMIVQGAQLAFYLAAMGDGCIVLNPRVPADQKAEKERDGQANPFLPLGVYISVINPYNAFPKFQFGVPGNQLEDLFCAWEMDPGEAEARYHIKVTGKVQVIHYYSRTEKRILCNGKDVIPAVEHNLGFCPAVWAYNKANDGRPAQSEIRMAINMNEQLGLIYEIWLDAAIWAIHPIIHVHDREYVSTPSDSPEVGPGATISTVQSGKVELLSPQGHPEVAQQMMHTLVDSMHQVTGVSPIQTQGIIDRSNVSARSVSSQQSPMEQRLMLSNLLLSEAYQQLNARILLMLTDLKDFKKVEFPLYGEDSQGTFNDTFTSADIGGWIRTAVKWDPTLGTSRHELMSMVLQVYKESLVTGQPYRFPFRMVLEAAGYDDAQMLMDEAAEEAKASAPPPPPPGADGGGGPPPPGGGNAMQDASALQQGGLAAAGPPGGGGGGAPPPDGGPVQPPPPQMPGFPPVAGAPTQGGMGTAAPVPDIASMVQTATAGLRLHGEVTGATGGPDNSIVVMVSDHRDIAQVRQAVEAVSGGLTVTVKMDKSAAGSK